MGDTVEEKRAYSRGYAAGLKRGRLERTEEQKVQAKEAYRRQLLLALAPAVIASGWDCKNEGEKSSVISKISCAEEFVDEVMRRLRF